VIGDGVTQRFSRFFSHFPKRKREIGTAKKCTKTWGIFSVEGSSDWGVRFGKKAKIKAQRLKTRHIKGIFNCIMSTESFTLPELARIF
jgi:hypothetical protein